jgi:hypothetical protein
MSKNGKRPLRAKVVQRKLQRQQSKERVKIAHHVVKLQQQNALGQGPVSIQELKDQLEANRSGLNDLVTAHNTNFKTYSDAFQHLDARLGSIMLVLNDVTQLLKSHGLLNEEILTTTTNVTSGLVQPFWEAYIQQYLDSIKKAAEATAMKLAVAPIIITAPEESDYTDMEFGGEVMKHVEASAG